MAIAIRGTSPGVTTEAGGDGTLQVVLNGTRQPNTDDVLVIVHCNGFYDYTGMATPTVGGSSTGVTAITDASLDSGANAAHVKSWYYVVGSTGDLTVEENETTTGDEEIALIVYVLSGVDTTTPVDVADGTIAAGGDMICPSVSPTSSDAFLICHVNTGTSSATSYTPPGGMSDQYDVNVGGIMTIGGATEQLSASGATGTRTFTPISQVAHVAVSIAVKTSSGAPPPVTNVRIPTVSAVPAMGGFGR